MLALLMNNLSSSREPGWVPENGFVAKQIHSG
jgi:hypothetical protein